jgi:hypothetical protein
LTESWLQSIWQFFSAFFETQNRSVCILEPLLEWNLFPARCDGVEVLVPVRDAQSVISMSGSSFTLQLEACLKKIGILQPLHFDYDLVPNKHLYPKLLGSVDNVANVLLALQHIQLHMEENGKRLDFSWQDSLVLLEYFSQRLHIVQSTLDAISIIQGLPIFQTVYNKLVCLRGCNAYMLSSTIPTTDMEIWASTRGIVFLKTIPGCADLLKFIGCHSLTDAEVYCGFIFIHFSLLSAKWSISPS